MAELAPIPSASVSTTVNASPLVRASERHANLKSLTNDIILFFLSGSQSPRRYGHYLVSHAFCVLLVKRTFPRRPHREVSFRRRRCSLSFTISLKSIIGRISIGPSPNLKPG